MRVYLIKRDKIIVLDLPKIIHGNYWLTDSDSNGKDRNLINIVENNNAWQMLSNYEALIYENNTQLESVILTLGKFYTLKIKNEEDVLIYIGEVYSSNTFQLMAKKNFEIFIGSDDKCQLCLKNGFMAGRHAKLLYNNNEWGISSVTDNDLVFVNNIRIINKKLENGDVIFLGGLKIIIIKNTIIIDNIGSIKVDSNLFQGARLPKQSIKENDDVVDDISLYNESDYFFKAPRFKPHNDIVNLNVEAAPMQEKENKTPLIYSIGPMITMGMTSLVTSFTAINGIISGERTFAQSLPSIIIAFAMLSTIILWPLLAKRYEKNQKKKDEEFRVKKYTEYIESKRVFIANVMKNQKSALLDNYPDLEDVKKIIKFKKTNLWERKTDDDDFLRLRLGIGTLPVNMNISYPEEHFQLEENNMKPILDRLINDSKNIDDVPITISFVDKYISSIIGENDVVINMAKSLLLQLIAFHSYDDVKIVIFTDEKNERKWEFSKILPHCWSDDKLNRFYATNVDEMKQVSSYLEEIFESRNYKNSNSNASFNYKYNGPYYFIIIDNISIARNIEIIKKVLESKSNLGFSILILNDKLNNLPNECMCFISIGHNDRSIIFEDQIVIEKQKKFIAQYELDINLDEYALKLANIPIESEKNEYLFPKSISFLEMYNVGKVEQLNSFNRWQVNTPINSLQAPIGIDRYGNILKLDLHEKFHGPHGLIAGMTGSGKSELIITYILSLAVNYHPDEVSFIIIDYKGGGVALAFEDRVNNTKLPHIAGTITNLDTAEMNRALVSIESELRRRQKIFNEARRISNESTIDIYKYQKLYRNGVVTEPISHLFIICDEFAELKLQQPDFMDQLISTARIGRSLGVHLILATQKPAGIVDNQIVSNTRFRICLKVSEKQDSIDMIKTPDAALIKSVGRFYLQVGYNELFLEGLASWAGDKYVPTEKLRKKVDTSITFIDNVGYSVKNVDDNKKNMGINYGEQLGNIVKYLIGVADEQNIKIRKLWLDKIPEEIYVDKLAEKYSYKVQKGIINPIIGEYDDPSNQRQDLLTLNLSNCENVVIYGSSGSGKNLFLSDVIYSTITNHSSSEVNFYIMDFDSEMLKIFRNAPHVGDVITINEEEKVNNLFKLIMEKISERKRLFVDFNGDFNFYNRKSQNKIPLIVIIVSNMEAFNEMYDKSEDLFIQLTRECTKYGIVFIVTVNSTNGLRYRTRKNFNREFVLQMNDESDYVSILGNTSKVFPSKCKGRGIFKGDKVYEFQAAHPYKKDRVSEYIEIVCNKLNLQSSIKAESVPILPDIVTPEFVSSKINGLSQIPIGVDKKTLKIATWDFNKNYVTTISSLELKSIINFVDPLIKEFSNINCNILVFDSEKLLRNYKCAGNLYYYDKDFKLIIDSLYDNINKQHEAYKNSNFNKEIFKDVKISMCFIIGLEYMLNKLNIEYKNKFYKIVELGNLIGTIKLILVDSIDVFKKIEYDTWYRSISKNSEGIWIGNGITNQYTLKISKVSRELQEDVDIYFGYIVKRGVPKLTKFLSNGNIEVDYE